ncbi:Oidioi.mRNA.OKI2018_I69.chr2.g4618.t1.cds [Oikopleura dioica]|uniref:Oidioi.mRNA.OKI2018_I69.chr2.g4618.t1.cds n=1 Tax=Oikopleura dioica TaxID=34765 RepID=A0ABN7SXM4_OIKDI|nr:Oidioi.mRNA.OKI2018_I69.chr2.g4618.t1.cds [Oikopleura dioica]
MIVHFVFSALLAAALMGMSLETVCFDFGKKRRIVVAFAFSLGILLSLICMLAYVTWSRSRSQPSLLIGGTTIQPGVGFVLAWISSAAHFCTLLTVCLSFYLK